MNWFINATFIKYLIHISNYFKFEYYLLFYYSKGMRPSYIIGVVQCVCVCVCATSYVTGVMCVFFLTSEFIKAPIAGEGGGSELIRSSIGGAIVGVEVF